MKDCYTIIAQYKLALVFGVMWFPVSLPIAHDKVALLIGNGCYNHLNRLHSPENDIQQLSAVLKDLDFKVFALVDLTYSEMQSALTLFYRSLVINTYGLFYFSGHGVNDTSQNSYIAPVDCPRTPNLDLCFHLPGIINRMNAQKCRPLCVIDACRIVWVLYVIYLLIYICINAIVAYAVIVISPSTFPADNT